MPIASVPSGGVQVRLPNGRTVELRVDVSIGPVRIEHHGGGGGVQLHIGPAARPSGGTLAPRTPPASTLRGTFSSLARSGRLLQQTDARLAQRQLLIPAGGLCATTSAVNALHAAFSALRLDTSAFARSDYLVARLVDQAWRRVQEDARAGLRFSTLALVVNEVANTLERGVGVHVAAPPWGWRAAHGIDFAKLLGDDSTLALLSVRTGPNKAHANAVLDVDEGNQVITYSDPNYPDSPQARRFTLGRDGGMRIDGFGDGELLDVLHFKTNRFDPSKAQRFDDVAGKRVRVTLKDGSTFVATATEVRGPSPEYPRGRLIAYSMFLGSGGGGTTPLDDVAAIEHIAPPSAQELAAYKKHVGKTVTLTLTDERQRRDLDLSKVKVLELVGPGIDKEAPSGGLRVEIPTRWGTSNGVLQFDHIKSIGVSDARLAARRPRQ